MLEVTGNAKQHCMDCCQQADGINIAIPLPICSARTPLPSSEKDKIFGPPKGPIRATGLGTIPRIFRPAEGLGSPKRAAVPKRSLRGSVKLCETHHSCGLHGSLIWGPRGAHFPLLSFSLGKWGRARRHRVGDREGREELKLAVGISNGKDPRGRTNVEMAPRRVGSTSPMENVLYRC